MHASECLFTYGSESMMRPKIYIHILNIIAKIYTSYNFSIKQNVMRSSLRMRREYLVFVSLT